MPFPMRKPTYVYRLSEAFKRIGGDCHTPVAAFCDVNASGKLELRAMYGTEDGSKLASTKVSEADVAGCVSEKEKTAKWWK